MCMYAQECYVFICTLCTPRNFIVIVQFSSVRYVRVIIDEEEQWRLVRMSHEGVGTTVEAKAMSGHFGRDKSLPTNIQSLLPWHNKQSEAICGKL